MMEAKDTVISNDDIDDTRFRVLDELEKKARVNWWDICKAVEEISGKQASMDAEQFLIDITNTTGVEVAKAQAEISFRAGYKHALEGAVIEGGFESIKKLGRREVMEFKCDECSTPGFVYLIIPVKKLKEWGIND